MPWKPPVPVVVINVTDEPPHRFGMKWTAFVAVNGSGYVGRGATLRQAIRSAAARVWSSRREEMRAARDIATRVMGS